MADALDTAMLCRQYGSSVLRRCQAIVGDRAEAEDAAQEVFLTVMTKGHQFRHDAAVTTWLYRVTTNVCLNRLRSAKRRRAREVPDPVLEWGSLTPVDPYQHYRHKSLLTRVARDLDAESQAIFVYRYVDGMTLEEIASTTGTSRRTVAKRLKAIEQLITVLESAP
ncbi:MAG: RNA polymerase sigma factor [Deltaproteobacteria bacterium]|nr:RNA polymerase sigma factor [Deltaproteobacteria bacterium]